MAILGTAHGVPAIPCPTSVQTTYIDLALSCLAVRLRFDRYIDRQHVCCIKSARRAWKCSGPRGPLMREV